MAAAAGPALAAASSIMSGRATARGMANEAAQADIQARGVDLQATQTSERRREDRRAAIAALEAGRAAKGLSADTPSAIAAESELRRQGVRDEGVEALGFTNQASALRLSAKAKRRGVSNAMTAGYLGAAGSLMSGAQNAAASGMFGGTPGALNIKSK